MRIISIHITQCAQLEKNIYLKEYKHPHLRNKLNLVVLKN